MTIVHLPDELARRLEAEAVSRGITVDQVAVEALQGRFGADPPPVSDVDPLTAFIGAFNSGNPAWAGTDTHELRAGAAARRQA